VFGVVPKGAVQVFWQSVHAGARKASVEAGADISWNAPSHESDRSRQIAIVDAMINRRLSGIALAPIDRAALSGVVDRASEAGIPVVIFDSAVDTPNIVSYVATDNT
jgi:ribose transport system substrate-binding protein